MRALQITELSGPRSALTIADLPEPEASHMLSPGSAVLIDELYDAILVLEKANTEHPAEEGLELAKYMRDTVIPAMESTRAVADKLERIVADDLWPLPKYSEMLFIK